MKLVGFKKLLQDSLNLYRKNFKDLLIISTLFFGIPAMLGGLVGVEPAELSKFYWPELKGLFQNAIFVLPLRQFVIVILLAFLMNNFGTALIVSYLKHYQINQSFKETLSKYGFFLWTSLLSGIIISLGVLVFIIPGVLAYVFFILSNYLVIYENKVGIDALIESARLVKKCFTGIALRILGLISILFLFSAGLSFIPYLGNIVFSVLLIPFSIIYYYLIYNQLKKVIIS